MGNTRMGDTRMGEHRGRRLGKALEKESTRMADHGLSARATLEPVENWSY
jgi:hypothetical protein